METADEKMSEIDCRDVCAVREEEDEQLIVVEVARELRDPPLDRCGHKHPLTLPGRFDALRSGYLERFEGLHSIHVRNGVMPLPASAWGG